MTKVIFHEIVKGFRGQGDGLIFRLLPDGSTIVTKAPAKKNSREKKRAWQKRSKAQKAHNYRFAEAIAYARAAQVKPVYVELAEATPMMTAYNFALSDWMHAPEIQRIEKKKGCIRAQATDNVMVTRVQITILDADGRIVEAGEATRKKGDWWEFASQAQGTKIVAEAWDLPGNLVRQDVLSES